MLRLAQHERILAHPQASIRSPSTNQCGLGKFAHVDDRPQEQIIGFRHGSGKARGAVVCHGDFRSRCHGAETI